MNTKTQIILSSLILFATASLAQMMVPMNNTIRTPYGNANYTTWVPGPRMYYGGTATPSYKYPFTIVFKSDKDSTLLVKAKIDASEKNHVIRTKVNKQKVVIKPTDTREIYRIDNSGLKITGMPTDSCWLFLAVRGKINAYSYLAEKGLSSWGSIIAVQKGEGAPILPLNKDNLEEMVADNPEALKFAKKKKLEKALTTYNKQ
ncbi:MAG: hypothetical protein O9311_18905 [Cytophagales bacterium]|jgi:hypothetical protein|nr:hypothetical protein [Cytophagales bacterium]